MKQEISHMSENFKILSNDVRLCILSNLYKNGESKVNQLQECAGVSQSLVSQQLSKLRIANIISADKRGNEVYYSIKNEEIKRIIKIIIFKELE